MFRFFVQDISHETKDVIIDGTGISIDIKIAGIVEELNRKGYRTCGSCAGHKTQTKAKRMHFSPYIYFEDYADAIKIQRKMKETTCVEKILKKDIEAMGWSTNKDKGILFCDFGGHDRLQYYSQKNWETRNKWINTLRSVVLSLSSKQD